MLPPNMKAAQLSLISFYQDIHHVYTFFLLALRDLIKNEKRFHFVTGAFNFIFRSFIKYEFGPENFKLIIMEIESCEHPQKMY